MKALEMGSIEMALDDAVTLCWKTRKDFEEAGGIILFKEPDEYLFIPVTNSNTGTDEAPVLYSADRNEYAKYVIPMFKWGYKQYASFHTHPQFLPNPSSIDMTVLFPGFPINYIYSGLTNRIVKFTWVDPKDLSLGVNAEEVEYE